MNKTNLLVGVLAVSLAANVFFVGYHGSQMLQKPEKFRHGRMMGPDGGMDKAISHLDPKYQEQIKAIVDNHRSNVGKDMEEMRGLFAQIGPVLTAPTFDADKLAELSAQIDSRDKAMKANMSAMMTTIAKTLPDEQRVTFFTEMFENMSRRGPHGGPGKDRGDKRPDGHGALPPGPERGEPQQDGPPPVAP